MRIKALSAVAIALVAPVAVGCGDDDGNGGQAAAPTATATQTATATATATSTQAATAQPAGRALTIRMTEFAFDPNEAVAKAGKVKITAPNEGTVVHELVLLKTDADPGNLPKADGKVDESTSVGEIPDVEAGSTKQATFTLEPGKYAMVCALPGHYEGGMYGSLTVR
ncbi:MAG TPA: cupredoxin domain-containing protein [Solirubrobacteraceae bacterium]|nr:cupredoxin domain-containing protein [Solirubrobacteraceae bacterium]